MVCKAEFTPLTIFMQIQTPFSTRNIFGSFCAYKTSKTFFLAVTHPLTTHSILGCCCRYWYHFTLCARWKMSKMMCIIHSLCWCWCWCFSNTTQIHGQIHSSHRQTLTQIRMGFESKYKYMRKLAQQSFSFLPSLLLLLHCCLCFSVFSWSLVMFLIPIAEIQKVDTHV